MAFDILITNKRQIAALNQSEGSHGMLFPTLPVLPCILEDSFVHPSFPPPFQSPSIPPSLFIPFPSFSLLYTGLHAKGLTPDPLRLPSDSGFCSSVVLSLDPTVEELKETWVLLNLLDKILSPAGIDSSIFRIFESTDVTLVA